MNTTIKFYRKSVYGNENIYIADEATRTTIALLTGMATIKPIHMDAFKALGFTFEEIIAPVTLKKGNDRATGIHNSRLILG